MAVVFSDSVRFERSAPDDRQDFCPELFDNREAKDSLNKLVGAFIESKKDSGQVQHV